MALRYGFFNSINNDRVYDADFLRKFFGKLIGNGVFPNPSNNFQVVANGGMNIKVLPGVAWIEGAMADDTQDYIIALDVADGVLNRIDRIVVRVDILDREIRIEAKKGNFANLPVAKTLQRDADAYEIALADVYIGKGIINITQPSITDTRLNSSLCGIVHGLVQQVDTTTLFTQYQSWYTQAIGDANTEIDQIKTQFEADFNAWFAALESILDANVAANLLNMINDLDTAVSQHLADDNVIKHKAKTIALEDTGNKFTATNVEGAMTELFTNVSNGKQAVGTAITDVDNSIVIPTEPSFSDLASAIGGISTGHEIVAFPTISGSLSRTMNTKSIRVGGVVYEKTSEIEMPKGITGEVEVSFTLTNYSGARGKIYLNGVPVGVERMHSGSSQTTYTENIVLIEKENLIQLYTRTNVLPSENFAKNFSVSYYSKAPDPIVKI